MDKEMEIKDKNNQQNKQLPEESNVSSPESAHQRLIEEAAAYKDKYVRLYAEFENARKRMERERVEFIRYANQELLAEFLNILDNLERSVEAAQAKHEDYQAFLKGVEMVMAQVHDLLKKQNVEAIEAQGKMFDPHCHEVLLQEETEKYEEGIVLEELQKGYRIGERLIRTAKVKVAKRKQEEKK